MSERKFKFISPGVFIEEIDKSRLPAVALRRGPVVIGRSERGPSMRPITVDSFNEFVQTFGVPIPGGRGGDIWREGNFTAPTYAAYAAQAYLRNNGPITFIRLLGAKHDAATTDDGTPGWKLTSYAAGAGGGAQGLFVFNSASFGISDQSLHVITGTLAAVFYARDTTTRITLSGSRVAIASTTSSQGQLIEGTGNNFEFKANVYTGANVVDTITFNFNRDSDKFIRKAFNTNPTLVNTNTVQTNDQKTYFLGESFEGVLTDDNGGPVPSAGAIGNAIGVILPLKPLDDVTTIDGANFKQDSSVSKSGWIFSQALSSDTASFSPANLPKLFRIVSLVAGEWPSKNLKISIRDIKESNNDYDPFGTFTVLLRDVRDSDSTPVVLERFENLNLNPISPNYIVRVIGDVYTTWDEQTRRVREHGIYANRSKFIRVEVPDTIADGGEDPRLLPAGFYGPAQYADFVTFSGSANAYITGSNYVNAAARVFTFVTGASGVVGGLGDSLINLGAPGVGNLDNYGRVRLTASIQFPKLKLRASSADSTLTDPIDAYFGLDTRRSANGRLFDETYYDLVKYKPYNVSSHASGTYSDVSLYFTLDDLSGSFTSITDYEIDAVYAAGNRVAGTSITATGLSGSYLGVNNPTKYHTGSFAALLGAGFDKFTLPLVGGFDGFDITEREPLRNSLISSTATTDINSYVYNTYKRAIDIVKDRESLDINVAVVPGLTNPSLTTRLVDNCEERADVLAIIDIQNDYTSKYERIASFDEKDNIGDVDLAISNLKSRELNSSYGCAYYPWVLIRDTVSTGQTVWVPPSVAALGVMGYSETRGEIWFAPAGFNRGGLTDGAAGLSVINVRQRLSSKQRDRLYEQHINPIASFPAEGIVVFGQKTLQMTQSAMDRVNVRRLLIFLKKEISFAASRILFDQNVPATWARFVAQVEPLLASVKARFGLTDFKLVLDETTTTPELIDRNILYAKIFLKPARAIEYIALDFIITATGASFEE